MVFVQIAAYVISGSTLLALTIRFLALLFGWVRDKYQRFQLANQPKVSHFYRDTGCTSSPNPWAETNRHEAALTVKQLREAETIATVVVHHPGQYGQLQPEVDYEEYFDAVASMKDLTKLTPGKYLVARSHRSSILIQALQR